MSNKKLNVLWISHFVPYPPKGGMLSRSYNLLKEVAAENNVYLLAFIQRQPLVTMFDTLEQGLRESQEHLSVLCKKVEFIDIPCEIDRYGKYTEALRSLITKLPYTINWLTAPEMSDAIAATLDSHNIDVVHVDTISLAQYIDAFRNIPRLLTHHNIESHMMLRRISRESNFLKKMYYWIEGNKLKAYERELCRQFQINITCSDLDSDRLREIDSSLEICEIENGVDINYFKPGSGAASEADSLIFVGGLNWYPNRDAMIYFADRIWPLLKERCQVRMDVIGQDPPQKLLDLAKHDPSYKIYGFVDDVRPYIEAAGIYVCPIREGGGTRLKILDALAMKKPLVAHPLSCEGIDVKDEESVLFATRPEEFRDKILLLLDDKELRNRMGAAGRELVCRKYSFTYLGDKLSRLYSRVCQSAH